MTTWSQLIGTTMGPYSIESSIASGMYGHVYRARHRQTQGEVALKVLKEEWSRDPRVRSRFRAEATAAAMIGHSNVVSVYDISESDRKLYIAMELLHGKTLGQYLRTPDYSVHRGLTACYQTSSALSAAHEKRVVHCDVKPDNIMLVDDDRVLRVKVLDFGIAALEAQLTEKDDGDPVGTPLYMSPEVWQNREITAKSDVYSLGLVIYEVLARRPPFSGANEQLKKFHIEAKAPALPDGVAAPLVTLVDSCLAKRPADRPHMLEVKHTLRDHLQRDATRSVEVLAREWISAGRSETYLLDGKTLKRALEQVPDRRVGDIETEFLLASAESEAVQETQRLKTLITKTRSARRTARWLALAFAVTTVIGFVQCRANAENRAQFEVATNQAREATKQAREAKKEARTQTRLAKEQKQLAEEAQKREQAAAASAKEKDELAGRAQQDATAAGKKADELAAAAAIARRRALSDKTKKEEADKATSLAQQAATDAQKKQREAAEARRRAEEAQASSDAMSQRAEGARAEAEKTRKEAEAKLIEKVTELAEAKLLLNACEKRASATESSPHAKDKEATKKPEDSVSVEPGSHVSRDKAMDVAPTSGPGTGESPKHLDSK